MQTVVLLVETSPTPALREANARGLRDADEDTVDALRAIYADLEDCREGIGARAR